MNKVSTIEELSEQQWDEFAAAVKGWDDLVISTELVDLQQAETAIAAVYALIGLPAPAVVLCASPHAIAEKVEAARELFEAFLPTFEQPFASARREFEQQVRTALSTQRGERVLHQLQAARERVLMQLMLPTRRSVPRSGNSTFLWAFAYDFAFAELSKFLTGLDAAEALAPWAELAKATPGFAAFEDTCFICARPSHIAFDETGGPHSETGPAVQFADGFSVFIRQRRIAAGP